MQKRPLSPQARFWLQQTLAILSLIVSTLVLGLIFRSWPLAIAFMLLLLAHELGHLLALRIKKLPARGPYFIPLIGAFVAMPRLRKPADITFVALAGPFLGGLGAIFCYGISWYVSARSCYGPVFTSINTLIPRLCFLLDGGHFWLVLANVGFYLNLLNLSPLHPLDGGRVAPLISKWLFLLGIPLGIFLLFDSFSTRSPLESVFSLITLVLVIVSVALTVVNMRKPPYRVLPVRGRTKVIIAVAYVAMVAMLGYGWWLTYHLLNIVNGFS